MVVCLFFFWFLKRDPFTNVNLSVPALFWITWLYLYSFSQLSYHGPEILLVMYM